MVLRRLPVARSSRETTRTLPGRIAAFALPHYDEAMSFSETIFLFFLALIIFGPKKLPEIARQAGRLLAELRRASNEFKSQIETEIAHLEVERRRRRSSRPVRRRQESVASPNLNPAAKRCRSRSRLESPVKPGYSRQSNPTGLPADSNSAASRKRNSLRPRPSLIPALRRSQESHV